MGDETLGQKIGFPGATGAAKKKEETKEDDGWFASAKKKLAETMAGSVESKAKVPNAKPSNTVGAEIGYPGSK